jgi:hypothetical protein
MITYGGNLTQKQACGMLKKGWKYRFKDTAWIVADSDSYTTHMFDRQIENIMSPKRVVYKVLPSEAFITEK